MFSQEGQLPEIRFIKLGRAGKWEEECIEGRVPSIRLGFNSPFHQESLNGEWDAVLQFWRQDRNSSTASSYLNQIKQFYTLPESTVWITFYKRKLWWCNASAEVEELPDKSRIRKVIGQWSCKDQRNNELFVDRLSGRLTKVQGYRGTICSITPEQRYYLLTRLRGELSVEVTSALQAMQRLELCLEDLIKRLGWKDFELLVDLIFARAGWQRISALGKTEKSIDLDLVLPVSNKRAFVQIKSEANLAEFLSYKRQFQSMDQYNEMYFVVHSPSGDLNNGVEPNINLLVDGHLAKLVLSAGLANWLITKSS